MSVRAGLLAILSLGPAYGLQLRDEFLDRAPHRANVNVGQIYSTLDRLMTAGLVRSAGLTADNLPLYGLTPAGEEVVAAWVTTAEASGGDRLDDLLDQVLIVSSLPGVDASVVRAGYVAQLRGAGGDVGAAGDLGAGAGSGAGSSASASAGAGAGAGAASVQAVAAAAVQRSIREALVAWLESFEKQAEGVENPAARPLRDVRPSRGRRPGASGVAAALVESE